MAARPLRAQFPVLARVAYLNAGTDGPVAARAVAAARSELERQVTEGRTRAHSERRRELQSAQRDAYAQLLRCEPADVALTTSTTEGIARAVGGLGLGPGDEIVTSDEEHPGLLGALQAARDLRGAEVRMVALAQLADAVGPATRLVACSHVSWVTGAFAPAALADVDVPVLLDGAQGIGAVPTDVARLGCDMYAGSGQKWLCGPDGAGMLYVSPALRERLAATTRGYANCEDSSAGLDASLHPDARRYDAPALPVESSALALEALAVLAEHGWAEVQSRARGLAAQLADRLRDTGHDVCARGASTLVSWRCEGAEEARSRLMDVGVVVRDIPGRGLLRASVGAWNDESDIERLLEAL